jgi:hypothetical protein
MIFVSYSHFDNAWREEFEKLSTPLRNAIPIEFWSDTKILAGDWDKQIKEAMAKAEGVVFLVSPAFLASEYITKTEVPYFLNAEKNGGLMIFWAYLEPCDLTHEPGKRIKALTAMKRKGDALRPMSSMVKWQWQETMLAGCYAIDEELVKPLEKPVIHPDAKKKPRLKRIEKDFLLLGKPARREVEVLVYSGGAKKWWRQTPVKVGSRQTTIHIGDDHTKSGTEFTVVALTTESTLTDKVYLSLPDYRTKSEIMVKRA